MSSGTTGRARQRCTGRAAEEGGGDRAAARGAHPRRRDARYESVGRVVFACQRPASEDQLRHRAAAARLRSPAHTMGMNARLARAVAGEPEVMVDINTTPLIDVMLVLLDHADHHHPDPAALGQPQHAEPATRRHHRGGQAAAATAASPTAAAAEEGHQAGDAQGAATAQARLRAAAGRDPAAEHRAGGHRGADHRARRACAGRTACATAPPAPPTPRRRRPPRTSPWRARSRSSPRCRARRWTKARAAC
jgi:hypothetical protein